MQLKILTPRKVVRIETIDGCLLPSMNGDFGVLKGHCPLVTVFDEGLCSFWQKSKSSSVKLETTSHFACFSGFLKIQNDTVLLLTRSIVDSKDLGSLKILEEDVKKAKERGNALSLKRANLCLALKQRQAQSL